MRPRIELSSPLTDRYQTTMPSEKTDPVVRKFLQFLAKDMQARPQRIRAVNSALMRTARALVRKVKVDFEQRLRAEDE